MAEDSDSGDVGGEVSEDTGGYGYDSGGDSALPSSGSSYSSSSPTWEGIAAGYQSVIDQYAGMNRLDSSHSYYGGFGSQAGAALDEAIAQNNNAMGGVSALPASGVSPQQASNAFKQGSTTQGFQGSNKNMEAAKGQKGLPGGGAPVSGFKLSPAAAAYMDKRFGKGWFNGSRLPEEFKTGGAFDPSKAEGMAKSELQAINAANVANARKDIANKVIGALPTPSAPQVNTSADPNVLNKKAYWSEYYDLPPEARGILQPGLKKAWLDIAEKALKSAGL